MAEAVDYYLEQSDTVAPAFLDVVAESFARIQTFAAIGAAEMGARSLLLSGFPFRLVYVPSSDEVLVLAVAHSGRKPGYWRGRL